MFVGGITVPFLSTESAPVHSHDSFNKLIEPVVDAWVKADSTKRREIVEHFAGMFDLSDATRETWFVDYGTENGWSNMQYLKFAIASRLHELDKKERPEAHQSMAQRHNWKYWHEYNCSCGLCHSVDSSD